MIIMHSRVSGVVWRWLSKRGCTLVAEVAEGLMTVHVWRSEDEVGMLVGLLAGCHYCLPASTPTLGLICSQQLDIVMLCNHCHTLLSSHSSDNITWF